MKKRLILLLSNIFILIISVVFIAPNINLHAEEKDDELSWGNVGSFRESTYFNVHQKWLETNQVIELAQKLEFSLDETNPNNQGLDFQTDGSVSLIKGETAEYVIEVEEAGLYELGLSYKPSQDFTNEPTVGIEVNGEIPFNEVSNIALEVTWSLEERSEEDRYNRFNNELLPYSVSNNGWYEHFIDDVNSRYTNPYKFLLKEGTNVVRVTNTSQTLQLGKLYLGNTKENIAYSDYIKSHKSVEIKDSLITVQAEKMSNKNNIEAKAAYYKDPAMTPNAYKNTVLNMLDGSSTSHGGSKVTYTFPVEETGLYNITFKYLQNTLNGLTCTKAIYINGEIPFKEFEAYSFPEAQKWVNHTLNKDGNNYFVYLEKGDNTISLETTTAHYNGYIEELYKVMDEINNLGLTITSLTGSNTNQFTDYPILKTLPTLVDDLNSYADRVDAVYNAIDAMSKKEASEISTLQIAAKQLRRLTKNPNKIHLKLSELNSGSGSAYQLIGTTIGILLEQPISFDAIYFSMGNVSIPKARKNFFVNLWFSIQSFFYSFLDERYKVSADNSDDTLEVWVAQSNLYLDIIQSMVDSEFTKETGIDVKVSILPSSQKIILNNATNTNPDVVLSIDSWEPYNYALRGMLEDLSQYEGFDDVTKNIYSNCFTPVIFEDGVYAIPETQGLNLLFYRKDILEYLDLEAPRTWDDVIHMLPILQSYQMNFFHPLGSDSSYKNYSTTTPFIYAYGGEVFSENGMTSVLNDEEVIQAITYMTDLFNIYNLPRQVASFFEHFRSGTLPVGIGSLDMYLQLKYASPELAGQWGIVQIPGFDTDNNGEVESWTTAYGKSSIMFSSSNMKEEAWDFIKWWNSTETQTEYLQNIKMCLGEKYLIIPANVDALEASPWDQEIKTQVTLAAKWSRIPAVLPGSYAVERELSNVWNKVVIDMKDVRVAVGEGIDKVNRELKRKFEEFGYIVDGEVVKDYVVPNNDNIHNWVKGRDYYEK